VSVHIRRATEPDLPLILNFIQRLADYERMSENVVATERELRAALFGARPAAEVLLAYIDEEPAGFAVYHHTFSTFLAKPGIYLEDLFVEPHYRRSGIGAALMAAVAKLSVELGGALSWSVLKWNQPSIDFYLRLGASENTEWSSYRLAGDALKRLAAKAQ
jgi:GNAT superfamily N-acetyltransferase